MRLRSVLRVAPAFSSPLLAGAFLFVLACSGQQEGQQCSTLNGSADCASGLTCTPGLPNVNGARCCPSDRNLSTTVVCGTPMLTTADSAAPSTSEDGQAGDESTEASAPEASTDDGALDDAAASPDATLDDAAAPDALVPDALPPSSDTDAASADAASE